MTRYTLNDHFSDWNLKKTMMLDAINTSTLALWHADVEAWEEDHTKSNPFKSQVIHASVSWFLSFNTDELFAVVLAMTQAMVCLEFAERERHDLQDGIDLFLHAEISPSVLIVNGLELEDQQWCLCADRKTPSQNPSDNQKAKIQIISTCTPISIPSKLCTSVASGQVPVHAVLLTSQRQKKCASQLKYEAARVVLDNLGDHLGMVFKIMQRVLAFFRWEMTQWNEWGTAWSFTKDADREGSVAYAQCQVSVQEGLVMCFSMLWRGTLSAVISELDPVPEINNKMADDQTPSLEGPPLQGDDE
ncbi:uncharacterized protein EDB91DRAFT_1085580 [Suillus paluster]|uniref:uncharacterized protein n=1 Tax=Suillus paluster TaxID=48578 RepID=UPI001B8616EF|nr:uncharacterized protein EDB91DRAFT_1085580 [Suillus paluster]KAG1729948.1 hypothetical protein EDB91DRAFT_1085580 [Suillus paluster]